MIENKIANPSPKPHFADIFFYSDIEMKQHTISSIQSIKSVIKEFYATISKELKRLW